MTVLEDILDDLDEVYDLEFGEAIEVTGPSGDFAGIFSKEYLEADPGLTIGVRSSIPELRTRDADALAEGASVVIPKGGTTYYVTEPQPNGYGETIHRLRLNP